MNSLTKIGFGCVGLTSQPTQAKALRLLDCAYDHGIRFFDTAPIYGKGYSELILGKFIKDKRDCLTITTKFGLGSTPISWLPAFYSLPLNYIRKKIKPTPTFNTENAFEYHPVPHRLINKLSVERDLFSSLKRLNTSYVDNYLLHEATPSFLSEDAIDFLLLEKEKGTIKNLGLGVNNKNFSLLSPNELINWNTLQYEYGHNVDNESLYQKFSQKTHIYHSIFKSLPYLETPEMEQEKIPGFIFAKILSSKPNARILFSSSSEKNIINNLTHTTFYFNKK